MAEKKTTGSTSKGSSSKSASSRSASKKSPSKKSGSSDTPSGSRRASAPRAEAGRKASGRQVADAAARQLAELTSKEVEAVTGLERSDDGWTVEVEVLELRRIPSTTDVLASYEVQVDSGGELMGYQRRHRFVRGAASEGGA